MRKIQFVSKIMLVVFLVEVTCILATAILIVLWFFKPFALIEAYMAIPVLVVGIVECVKKYKGKVFLVEGVNRTPSEQVKHNEELRKEFREEIELCRAKELRKDVIIRHVNRRGEYPDVSRKKGISSWFKAGLLDTYHDGILIGLGWTALVEDDNGWREKDFKSDDDAGKTLMLTGEIPFDSIEYMNVKGDEYYYFPHIFCHFSFRGEPYKRLYYSEELDMGHGHVYYREVISFEEVQKNSKVYKHKKGKK